MTLQAKDQKRRIPKTHCKHGHLLAGDNLYTRRGIRECRACRNNASKKYKASGRCPVPSAETMRKVFAALREGKTLRFIKYGLVPGGKRGAWMKVSKPIVPQRALQGFMRQNPAGAKLIRSLVSQNHVAIRQQRRSTIARSSAVSERAYDVISAITASLPDHLRDDVRSEMFLAIAEGRLPLREAAARVSEFVTAHNRTFSKFMPGGGLLLSLDQPAYADETGTRLVDTVSTGLWS